jgi:hypothetical protein
MATKRTKAVTKKDFTEKKPPNLLTNDRLFELKAEWDMMYENPSMREIVLRDIQNITDRILAGEVLVERG